MARTGLKKWIPTTLPGSWTTEPIAAVRHLVPPLPAPEPNAPGQFGWADPAYVGSILEQAGFEDVSLSKRDRLMQLCGPGGAEMAAERAMTFGPAARATAGMPEDQRRAVRDGLRDYFTQNDHGEGVALPAAVWVVEARAG